MTGPSKRYVLLDRDGVINRGPSGGYVLNPAELELLPGAADAIARLNKHGFVVIVISNQQGVGKGLMTMEDLDAVTAALREQVASASDGRIEAFFYCPHLEAEGCSCRKPKPGLVLQARDRYGFALGETFFVGDSYGDVETAGNAGCPAVFVLSGNDAEGYRSGEPFPHEPAAVCADLAEAVDFILDAE